MRGIIHQVMEQGYPGIISDREPLLPPPAQAPLSVARRVSTALLTPVPSKPPAKGTEHTMVMLPLLHTPQPHWAFNGSMQKQDIEELGKDLELVSGPPRDSFYKFAHDSDLDLGGLEADVLVIDKKVVICALTKLGNGFECSQGN